MDERRSNDDVADDARRRRRGARGEEGGERGGGGGGGEEGGGGENRGRGGRRSRRVSRSLSLSLRVRVRARSRALNAAAAARERSAAEERHEAVSDSLPPGTSLLPGSALARKSPRKKPRFSERERGRRRRRRPGTTARADARAPASALGQCVDMRGVDARSCDYDELVAAAAGFCPSVGVLGSSFPPLASSESAGSSETVRARQTRRFRVPSLRGRAGVVPVRARELRVVRVERRGVRRRDGIRRGAIGVELVGRSRRARRPRRRAGGLVLTTPSRASYVDLRYGSKDDVESQEARTWARTRLHTDRRRRRVALDWTTLAAGRTIRAG